MTKEQNKEVILLEYENQILFGTKKAGTNIYKYFNTAPELYFGIEEIWINKHSKISITDLERTILQGFASPSVFGGIGPVLDSLKENLLRFNLERLISYAIRYRKASIAKRLGWSLEQAGILRKKLLPLAEIPASSYFILDSTLPRYGHCNKYWNLLINYPKKKKPGSAKKDTSTLKPHGEPCFLHKIIIPGQFLKTPPPRRKIEDTIKFYKKHSKFDEPVTVIRNNMTLIDGYEHYIAANELRLTRIKVKFID